MFSKQQEGVIVGNETPQQQQSEYLPVASISRLFPAKQLLTNNRESDAELKWIMKEPKKQQNPQIKRNNQLQQQICSHGNIFSQNDTLGYFYQQYFQQKLIYARVFQSLEELIKLCTHETKFNNNNSNLKCMQNFRKIRYLSGIFVPDTNSNIKGNIYDSLIQFNNGERNSMRNMKNRKYQNRITNVTDSTLQIQLHNLGKSKITNNLPFLSKYTQETNFKPLKIQFKASHQSANLLYSFQKASNQYDLIMHSDTNSKGSTQWFNFEVKFKKTGCYRFNIVNFTKRSSLYQQGMGVLYRSRYNQQQNESDSQWKRLTKDIQYYSNGIQIQNPDTNQNINNNNNISNNSNKYPPKRIYKTLSFSYNSFLSNQIVTFSYGYPYSYDNLNKFYSKLQKQIQQINKQIKINNNTNHRKIKIIRQVIGRTKTNMPIDVIKISGEYYKKKNGNIRISKSKNKNISTNYLKIKKQKQQRKSIIFMGRQHPGETQSSFIIEGIINYLLSNHKKFILQSDFIFHFIPMINIEGVTYGNYRTNISGVDLNRNWRYTNQQKYPQIYHIKKYLKQVNEESQISLLIDLHGHSKSFNSFFYGVSKKYNNNNSIKQKNFKSGKQKYSENPKTFPYFCSKKDVRFSFSQSNFTVLEDKKNTARVVLSEMFPEALVYTLENSFYGYKVNNTQNLQKQDENTHHVIQYTPQELNNLGGDFIRLFFEYYKSKNSNKSTRKSYIHELEVEIAVIQKQNHGHNNQVIKQSNDSDSQVELQVSDELVLNTHPSQFQQNEESIQTKNSDQLKKTKKSINYINYHRKNHNYLTTNYNLNSKPPRKGTYIQTIQLIQYSQDQRSDDLLLPKNQEPSDQTCEPKKRDGIERSLRPVIYLKKDKQNAIKSQRKKKSSVPLLVINPIKLQSNFQMQQQSKSISNIREDDKKRSGKTLNTLTFINERDLIKKQTLMNLNKMKQVVPQQPN